MGVGFHTFTRIDMWSESCCKCYTITAEAERASYSFNIVPGRIVGAAVVVTKLPALARGMARGLGGAIDDVIESLPQLLPT